MKKLFLLLVIVGLLLCVCTVAGVMGLSRLLGAYSAEALPDDCPEITVSQDAAIDFLSNVLTTLQTAPQTGRIRLTMTQVQLTSVVAIGAQLNEQIQSLQNLQNLSPEQLQQLEGLEGAGQLQALQNLLQQQAESQDQPAGSLLPNLSLVLTLEEPQVCMKQNQGLITQGYLSLGGWRQPIRVVTAPRASQGDLVLDFVEGNIGPVPMPELLFDWVGQGIAGAILAGQDYAEITEISVGDGTLTVAGRLSP